MTRKYEQTHPWLTFLFDVRRISHTAWMLLGAAQSKCRHIQGIPLDQAHAQELHKVYLVKGAMATTAIEGNTLTEQEVRDVLEKRSKIPESRTYLKQEVENIISAYNKIVFDEIKSDDSQISVNEICEYNRMVLNNIPTEDYVIPGKIRDYSVGVHNYIGAPAEDCEYLLQRLCETLNSKEFTLGDRFAYATGILKAIIAHLYLVWIHPFGDGNGRTARLVEVKFCAAAGIPMPACQLLSNFYNSTRSNYYIKLGESSKLNDFSIFLEYALRGLVDSLDEQIEIIRHYQIHSTWENTVHNIVSGNTPTAQRRRAIALDLFHMPDGVPRSQLAKLSPQVAALYRSAGTSKTISRDLNYLRDNDLIVIDGKIVRANVTKILAWMPIRKNIS